MPLLKGGLLGLGNVSPEAIESAINEAEGIRDEAEDFRNEAEGFRDGAEAVSNLGTHDAAPASHSTAMALKAPLNNPNFSGNVTVNAGDLKILGASKGIDFGDGSIFRPEIGEWDPNVNASIGSPIYSVQQGTYAKIGNKAFCQFHLALTGGTPNAGVTVGITGWPFTPSSISNYQEVISIRMLSWAGTTYTSVSGSIVAGSNTLYLSQQTLAGLLGLVGTELTNTGEISGSFSFLV